MSKNTENRIYRRFELGFSLFSAIFLLVVISVLGTIAVTISSSQHQTVIMDEMGSRAYQAARAGMEWGIYQISKGGVTGPACASLPQPTLPSGSQLSEFSIALSCSASSHTDGAQTIWVYHLVSTATVSGVNPDQENFFERQIESTFSIP